MEVKDLDDIKLSKKSIIGAINIDNKKEYSLREIKNFMTDVFENWKEEIIDISEENGETND